LVEKAAVARTVSKAIESMETIMAKRNQKTVKTSNPTKDSGKVKLGGLSPSLRPARIIDSGNVRLGGLSPAL